MQSKKRIKQPKYYLIMKLRDQRDQINFNLQFTFNNIQSCDLIWSQNFHITLFRHIYGEVDTSIKTNTKTDLT